jgi:hypothetical protein
MLPVALSEVLGISLLEVMEWYFDRSGEDERVCRIKDVLDRKRSEEEEKQWLVGEARRRSRILERAHQNRDDDSF